MKQTEKVFGDDTGPFLYSMAVYALILWFAPVNEYALYVAWFFFFVNAVWGISLLITREDFINCTYPASVFLLSNLSYLPRILIHGIIVGLWIRAGYLYLGLAYGYIGVYSTGLILTRTTKYLAGDFHKH